MKLIVQEIHPRAQRIKLAIPFQANKWRSVVKDIPGRFYHKEQRLWSIPNTKEAMDRVLSQVDSNDIVYQKRVSEEKVVAVIQLDEVSRSELSKAEEKLWLKGYSVHTLKNYKNSLVHFLKFFEGQDYSQLTKAQIEGYLAAYVVKHQMSKSKQNLVINAIKFYYEKVLNMPREYYELQRPKKSRTLPGVLSEQAVMGLINAPENLKHRAILWTIYACGLRISEAINLRITDIQSDLGCMMIKSAKGKKDRRVPLSKHLLDMLRLYYKEYKPAYWLFEGQDGGQYSPSSIQKIFRRAVNKAGVHPWATPHTLRHSCATHMLQNGVNLRYIQAFLGHSNPKTTEVYTHLTNFDKSQIQSPLDVLMDKNNGSAHK